MNNFIFSYNGNKYLESKKFFKNYDFSQYDIICEPFCGIFGFSRYAYDKGFRGEFYLNDLSKELIDDLQEMKIDMISYCDNISEEIKKYKTDSELTKCKDKSYGLAMCSNRLGNMCNIYKGVTKIKNFKLKKDMYEDFFQLVTFYNMDALDFINTLPKDKKVLIFYDPPYFDSCNATYVQSYQQEGEYRDSTHIYIDIMNNFKKLNHDQLLIVNYTSIMDYLFREYYSDKIMGHYQNANKRSKKHILYKNFINT